MASQRDRSPSYPNIPLGTALERLAAFESYFKRSPARAEKVGDAWGIKAKAYADRTAAALRYYGLIDYEQIENGRRIIISKDGRRYLLAQTDHIKQGVIKKSALRPAQIAKFWSLWGADRPADDAARDELVFNNQFSVKGARNFLKVYDATISYAGLTTSDKLSKEDEGDGESEEQDIDDSPPADRKKQQRIRVMDGERELTTGLLSKSASFRLIVSGEVGEKELERLIAKLEMDKDILAGPDEDEPQSDD